MASKASKGKGSGKSSGDDKASGKPKGTGSGDSSAGGYKPLDTYDKWVQSGDITNNLSIIQSLAMQGLSIEMIAKEIGIGERTLTRMIKNHPEAKAAVKKGRPLVVAKLQGMLMKRVEAEDTTAIIYALKVYGGDFFQDRLPDINISRAKNQIEAARLAFDREKWENVVNSDPDILLQGYEMLSLSLQGNSAPRNIADFEAEDVNIKAGADDATEPNSTV
jgi:hypothetical protein